MRTFILTTVIFFFHTVLLAQRNCDRFRTGKFVNVENGVVKSTIERNDSIQTEHHGEKMVKLRIEWIDDCTYRLIFIEGNEAWWASREPDRPTPDLIVRITKTKRKSYEQEAKFVDDDDFQYVSWMVKLE